MVTKLISEVAQELNVKEAQIRYAEKTLKIESSRDAQNNRVYSDQDVKNLKLIFDLKNKGLNYDAISEFLSKNEIVEKEPESTADITISNERIVEFMNLLQKNIGDTIESTIEASNTKLKEELSIDFNNKLEELKKENERIQEQHYKDLDRKLRELLPKEETKSNKSIFGIFKRKR